jgi:N-acetylglucosaminyldiphosphoundecaprenol N-acetyl-beta-D-mannosaminyltransferase
MKYLKKVKFGDFLVLEPSIQEIAEYFFKYIIECRKNNYITNCGSTLNAQKFVEAEKNPEFKKALQNMDHLRADGISIVWFSKFYGNPVRGRSSTTDFIHRLSEYSSAENRLRYFFLGNTEDVVEKAKTMIENKYDVEVVGVQHGFFDEDLDEEIVCRINDLKPDVLWIGMGVPKEQYWVFKNRDKLKVPLILTCGGTFNFVARRNLRAPLWIQKIGMEWLFRFFQEPKRLWRRYTLGNILFIWLAFREKFKQKRRTG